MKIVLLLFLFSTSSIFASYFESNALFMRLGEKEALDGVRYELEVSDEAETLYLDSEEVERRIYGDSGYKVIKDGKEREYVLDEQGRIVEEIYDGFIRRNYYSGDGLLLTSVLSDGDEIVDSSSYYYDSSDSILRVDTLNSSYIFSDDGFYFSTPTEDSSYILENMRSAIKGSSTVSINSDGSLSVSEDDGLIRTYDVNGLLIFEEGDDYEVSYLYDANGELERIERRDGRVYTISEYKDGVLESLSEYIDGTISRIITYTDGIREIRYKDGLEYAEVLYDDDKSTIIGLRML